MNWLVGTATVLALSGCQIGYYLHSAYYQTKLIRAREPIARVLESSKLDAEAKRKLTLTQEAKRFAEDELGLRRSNNYASFVQLDGPYVTYIVQAAEKFELKAYHWHFPFVGAVPYKGYFRRALAEDEARELARESYDTYVRGVSAFSTLGWFNDPVLSSMLAYPDVDLVETIIHETVHATLFVKGGTEFNERLATFMGHQGMLAFYRSREGATSAHVREADAETERLKTWYAEHGPERDAVARAKRLAEIQSRFVRDVKPKLKQRGYGEFERRELNNAMLLAYATYEYGLEDFEKLFEKFDREYRRTLDWLMTLKNDPRPDQTLHAFVSASGPGAAAPDDGARESGRGSAPPR